MGLIRQVSYGKILLVGGGMGLVSPVFERGGNVELPQNSQFDIILDQPLTVPSNTAY